jgi:pilus assembly protein CpaE
MRRRALVAAFAGSQLTVAREFEAYPSLADLPCRHCGPAGIAPPACGAAPGIARLACKVVIVDLDDDVEQAIGVIEHICSHNLALTVMAYSSRNDATLMRRSMQAGAREYLVEPLLQETVDELVTRICSRRANREKTAGKALVFVPSEGGVGVTTTALNFALALTKESGAKVVVVDMDFQLGEIASWLGVTATFSVVDALTNATRLDREFLATLLIRHGSGLAVLGSPEDYNFFHPAGEGVKTLFRILREEFDYVVVDAGTCHGAIQETLFEMADTLYLVTEMTFASLRNAHRLISYLSARGGSSHLEVVANRFNSRHGKIDDNSATKALTRPVNWKIPNTYASVRAAQDSGVPLAMEDSPYTRVLAQMARAACGKAVTGTRKASPGFHPFGLRGLPDPAET